MKGEVCYASEVHGVSEVCLTASEVFRWKVKFALRASEVVGDSEVCTACK